MEALNSYPICSLIASMTFGLVSMSKPLWIDLFHSADEPGIKPSAGASAERHSPMASITTLLLQRDKTSSTSRRMNTSLLRAKLIGTPVLFQIDQAIAHNFVGPRIDSERSTERAIKASDHKNDQPDKHRQTPGQDELHGVLDAEEISNANN